VISDQLAPKRSFEGTQLCAGEDALTTAGQETGGTHLGSCRPTLFAKSAKRMGHGGSCWVEIAGLRVVRSLCAGEDARTTADLETGGTKRLAVRGMLLDQRVGDGEVFVQRGDAEVELFFGDDERRSDDEVADPGLNRYAPGHHLPGDLVNN